MTFFDPSVLLAPTDPPNEAHFDGADLTPKEEVRLSGQLGKVYEVMKDGEWRTQPAIAVAAYLAAGETSMMTMQSVGARLRDLRKERFGAYQVERRKIAKGLYEYRVGGKGEGTPQEFVCRSCAEKDETIARLQKRIQEIRTEA